jgi:hypothetical protein
MKLRIFYDTELDCGYNGYNGFEIPPPTLKTAAELVEIANNLAHQIELDAIEALNLETARFIQLIETQAVRVGKDYYTGCVHTAIHDKLIELGYILVNKGVYTYSDYPLYWVFWDKEKYNAYQDDVISGVMKMREDLEYTKGLSKSFQKKSWWRRFTENLNDQI